MSLANQVHDVVRVPFKWDWTRILAMRAYVLELLRQLWPMYLVGSILILYGLTWGLPDGKYTGYSFQQDENAAVLSVDHISFPNFDPQFYPWGTAVFYQVYIVKTVVTLAGRFPLATDGVYVIGRLVVFASAIGAITLVFLLGRKLFDEWTGRLAAIVFAVLPGFVIPSHYFKMDTPMLFWVLAALVAAYRLTAFGDWKQILALGLLTGYSLTTKYSAAPIVPAAFVALWVADRKIDLRRSAILAASIAAGFVIGEPRVFVSFARIVTDVRQVAHDSLAGMPYTVGRPPAWLDYPVNVLPYALGLPMLALAALAFVWGIYRLNKKWLPIWTFLLGSGVLLANDNMRFVRYMLPLLPFLALLVAFLASSLRQTRIRPVVVPVMALVVLYTFLFSLSYVQVMGETDPRIQASQWIEKNIPAGSAIPVVGGVYNNLPDLPLIRYSRLEVNYQIPDLQQAASPYLIYSEFGTRLYQEAIDDYPEQAQFFDYVNQNYTPVAQFENSQTLLGINSKVGDHIPQDWLHPNPLITIWKRKDN